MAQSNQSVPSYCEFFKGRQCVGCQESFTNPCVLSCENCPETYACLECFQDGNVTDKHKEHLFKPVSIIMKSQTLFHKEWTITEELCLMEGLKRFGPTNWADMSELFFSGSKSASQIRSHYLDDYMGRFGHILPSHFVRKITDSSIIETSKVDDESSVFDKEHPKLGQPLLEKRIQGATILGKRIFPESKGKNTMVRNRVVRVKHQKNKKRKKEDKNTLEGYCIERDEFDEEYDDEAEKILEHATFDDDDTPEETELKLKVLDVYMKTLETREKRKEFIIRNDLKNYKKELPMELRQFNPEEILTKERLKIFLPLQTPEEHLAFVQSMVEGKLQKGRMNYLSNKLKQMESKNKKRKTDAS